MIPTLSGAGRLLWGGGKGELSDPREGCAEDDPDDKARLPYYAVQGQGSDAVSVKAEDQPQRGQVPNRLSF